MSQFFGFFFWFGYLFDIWIFLYLHFLSSEQIEIHATRQTIPMLYILSSYKKVTNDSYLKKALINYSINVLRLINAVIYFFYTFNTKTNKLHVSY